MLTPIDVVFDSDEVNRTNSGVSGSLDNPTFYLQPAIEDCRGISLIYANVPFTYFVIDTTNNKFTLNYNSLGNTTIAIEPGTYDSSNIGPQITSRIANTAGASGGATPAADLQIFVDNTSSKLVIYSAANTPFTINFAVPGTVARIIGFDSALYTSASTTFYNNAEQQFTLHNIQSPRVINLTGPSQMFLLSDMASLIHSKVRNQSSAKNLIGFWAVNSNYQGIINTRREDPPAILISKASISSVTFSLQIGNRTTYDSNNFLSLRGESFQIGLRFWVDVPQSWDSEDGTMISNNRGSAYNPITTAQMKKRMRQ